MPANIPKVIYGTSFMGNLYTDPGHDQKKAVIAKVAEEMKGDLFFDSAGKYGAGLALEELGACLEELGVPPENVRISNKLAWKRIPLAEGAEPTFEPGAWVNLKNDAVQDISYQGMKDLFKEGNELLGKYEAKIVSVHDPDEFLASATDEADLAQRKENLLGAYKALEELRASGHVESVGVGAKDLSAIGWISDHVQLDWAMFACSITPYVHSDYSKSLLKKLGKQGVHVINSAVYNGGFLLGGSHFDYAKPDPKTEEGKKLFDWRDKFHALCKEFSLHPSVVCVQFSFLFPEIKSVALNSSKVERVKSTIDAVNTMVPQELWNKGSELGLWNIKDLCSATL